MKVAGMIKQSLVDYPGKIAAVLFTRGCNFCCPFCHNGHLVVKPGKSGAQYLDAGNNGMGEKGFLILGYTARRTVLTPNYQGFNK